MSSNIGIRLGQVAIAAIAAVGVGSQALPAHAASTSITTSGIVLDSDTFDFLSFTGTVSSGGGNLNLGLAADQSLVTTAGTVGSQVGSSKTSFTYDFDFGLVGSTGSALTLAFDYQAPSDPVPLTGLSIALYNSHGVNLGGALDATDLLFSNLAATNAANPYYVLAVTGTTPGTAGLWHVDGSIGVLPSAVPVPAALLLFGTGLFGLAGISRLKRGKSELV
jgi:hypothetical protein